jgi:SAM-dependent methyltransferase
VRLFGALEAGVGLAALGRTPVEVRALYGVWVRLYDPVSLLWRNWLYPDLHRAFDRALAVCLPRGGRVLDLGCGTGANLERLLALDLPFGSYTGVDLTAEMLARARDKFGDLPNVSFQQLNLLTDPLPEGSFDLVVSTWVFSHLPEPERVVEKALARLRPGGHVILLFLAETGTWLDRLINPVLGFFSARPLPEEVYRRFPNLTSAERFGGGTTALVVLRKPEGVSSEAGPSGEGIR